jgi:site-specific DNA recombinase
MTVSTGKGGRYRYYKCNRRIGEGNDRCSCRSVPMEKLDGIVLRSLAEKVCVPARIKTILAELKRTIRAGKDSEGEQLRALKRERGTHAGVPSFDPNWLPDQGSNLGPAD